MDRERLRRARLLRRRARFAAVVSGDGGSPKMKNFMNAPMRMTTDSWPSRNPSVNDNLRCSACDIDQYACTRDLP